MNSELEVFRQGIFLAISICAPPLIAVSAASLLLSLVQAMTSVQEQTLQFIIKIFVLVQVFAITGQKNIEDMQIYFQMVVGMMKSG